MSTTSTTSAPSASALSREEAQGPILEQAGASVVLYPINDAVDHAVDHLCNLIAVCNDNP